MAGAVDSFADDQAAVAREWANGLCSAVSGLQSHIALLDASMAKDDKSASIEAAFGECKARSLVAERHIVGAAGSEVAAWGLKEQPLKSDCPLQHTHCTEHVRRIEGEVAGMRAQLAELTADKVANAAKSQALTDNVSGLHSKVVDIEGEAFAKASLGKLQGLERTVLAQAVRIDECSKLKLDIERGQALEMSLAAVGTKLVSLERTLKEGALSSEDNVHRLMTAEAARVDECLKSKLETEAQSREEFNAALDSKIGALHHATQEAALLSEERVQRVVAEEAERIDKRLASKMCALAVLDAKIAALDAKIGAFDLSTLNLGQSFGESVAALEAKNASASQALEQVGRRWEDTLAAFDDKCTAATHALEESATSALERVERRMAEEVARLDGRLELGVEQGRGFEATLTKVSMSVASVEQSSRDAAAALEERVRQLVASDTARIDEGLRSKASVEQFQTIEVSICALDEKLVNVDRTSAEAASVTQERTQQLVADGATRVDKLLQSKFDAVRGESFQASVSSFNEKLVLLEKSLREGMSVTREREQQFAEKQTRVDQAVGRLTVCVAKAKEARSEEAEDVDWRLKDVAKRIDAMESALLCRTLDAQTQRISHSLTSLEVKVDALEKTTVDEAARLVELQSSAKSSAQRIDGLAEDMLGNGARLRELQATLKSDVLRMRTLARDFQSNVGAAQLQHTDAHAKEFADRLSAVEQSARQKVSHDDLRRLEGSIMGAAMAAVDRAAEDERLAAAEALSSLRSCVGRVIDDLKAKAPHERLASLEKSVAAAREAAEDASVEVDLRVDERLANLEKSVLANQAAMEEAFEEAHRRANDAAKEVVPLERLVILEESVAATQAATEERKETRRSPMQGVELCVFKMCTTHAQMAKRLVNLERAHRDRSSVKSMISNMVVRLSAVENVLPKVQSEVRGIRDAVEEKARTLTGAVTKLACVAGRGVEESISALQSQVTLLEARGVKAPSKELLQHLEHSVMECANAVALVDAKLRRKETVRIEQVSKTEENIPLAAQPELSAQDCNLSRPIPSPPHHSDGSVPDSNATKSNLGGIILQALYSDQRVEASACAEEVPSATTGVQHNKVWLRMECGRPIATPARNKVASPKVRNLIDQSLLQGRRRKRKAAAS